MNAALLVFPKFLLPEAICLLYLSLFSLASAFVFLHIGAVTPGPPSAQFSSSVRCALVISCHLSSIVSFILLSTSLKSVFRVDGAKIHGAKIHLVALSWTEFVRLPRLLLLCSFAEGDTFEARLVCICAERVASYAISVKVWEYFGTLSADDFFDLGRKCLPMSAQLNQQTGRSRV